MNRPLLVIVGPTASGKSDLAMRIAKEYNGELICADSRTVYKGMDIGTAKPSLQDQKAVRHHLLDVVEPGQAFTAADFKHLALQAIADITDRDKLPIIVGGTGLYIDAVLFDYQFGTLADKSKRRELEFLSIDELQNICRDNNIEIPINSRNKRHLIRAIELGGLPKRQTVMRPNTLVVGISTNREVLRSRIEKRAHSMVAEGITDEIKRLGEIYGWDSEAMTGNIYRIFKGFIEGVKSESEALEEFVRSDMSLAKRQMTWFKRNPHIVWGNTSELERAVKDFLQDVVKR